MVLNEHDSFTKAKVVKSVAEEYEYIRKRYVNYDLQSIGVTTKDHKDKSYDLMQLYDTETNTTFTVYFDITFFFKNPEQMNRNINESIAKKRKKDIEYMNIAWDEILSFSNDYVYVYNYIFDESILAKDYDSKLFDLEAIEKNINYIITELNRLGDYKTKQILLPHAKNVQLAIKLTLPIVTNLKAQAAGVKYKITDYNNDRKKLDAISDDFDQTVRSLSI